MTSASQKKKKDNCGIYIHIPICRGKCIYCSFYSVSASTAFDWHGYVDAVISEFISRKDEILNKIVTTIYIGGGTPSLMPPMELKRLISSILEIIYSPQSPLPISDSSLSHQNHAPTINEITLEVNPDDVSHELALKWKEAGINRISMGVQSLNDDELKFIGRRHSSEQAINAFSILRLLFSNISLDIIFGLPGQDLSSLTNTLAKLISLRPEHISAYSLMYEERSAIIKMLEKGVVKETPEDISVEMFKLINSTLSDAGYNRYEISNYSLPGYHSQHNSSYWDGTPYIGLGPAAHSYDGADTRRWNKPNLREYLEPKNKGCSPHEFEILSDEELLEETLMTSLRVTSGLDLNKFTQRFGKHRYCQLIRKAQRHIDSGNLFIKDDFLRLTEEGIMISDEILVDLF